MSIVRHCYIFLIVVIFRPCRKGKESGDRQRRWNCPGRSAEQRSVAMYFFESSHTLFGEKDDGIFSCKHFSVRVYAALCQAGIPAAAGLFRKVHPLPTAGPGSVRRGAALLPQVHGRAIRRENHREGPTEQRKWRRIQQGRGNWHRRSSHRKCDDVWKFDLVILLTFPSQEWNTREAEILMALDHPNIIRIYGVYETPEKVFILLEVRRHSSPWSTLRWMDWLIDWLIVVVICAEFFKLCVPVLIGCAVIFQYVAGGELFNWWVFFYLRFSRTSIKI